MQAIRPPAVAGMFYPNDESALQTLVNSFLKAIPPSNNNEAPKAIIAPHAGYIYSGAIAANVYAQLQPVSQRIKQVMLLGPSHREPLQGLATSSATYFSTPLGNVALNKTLIEKVQQFSQVTLFDKAHAAEHSLEVQLPFLQTIFNDFKLVPLVVGNATSLQVCEILNSLWEEKETLIVVSSDLSHYLDYETACQMDKRTSQAIEDLNPKDIHYEHACGCNPINGLLSLAKQKGWQAKTIDLRNSGDTAGSKDRVVGYGAYVFH